MQQLKVLLRTLSYDIVMSSLLRCVLQVLSFQLYSQSSFHA